jgi:stage II sporulation protein D
MKVLLSAIFSTLMVASLASTAGLGQGPAKSAAHSAATLRIGLWTLWHDKEISIAAGIDGRATLKTCETCAASALTHSMKIRANDGRLVLGDSREGADAAWLTGALSLSAHGETLALRNPVRISARAGQLVLVVTLPVETYVERVVASESGSADSTESLKALAIVVRSFALHQAHGHADYDLCDSTHCQLLHWGGGSGRGPAAHAATLATADEALFFHGQRAQAWFHQNCGGRTATPQEVWPGKGPASKPIPWLASHVDTYCTRGGAREWTADLSVSDLTNALAQAGLARPGWSSLTVSRRGESGRAVMLAVGTSEKTGATQISAEDFRLAVGRSLGWGKILSTWFELSRQGDHYVFHGRGSGHGVGLCQAGAAVMSAQGRDTTQILAEYFPGALAADEATGRHWQTLHGQSFVVETLNSADAAYLPQLSQALAEAETRSGLQPASTITVRSFRSTGAFRNATLAPGWVAAFTEGNWIATQPLTTLAARKLLSSVLRHEFLHALIESRAEANTPLWLREGLVEALTDGKDNAGGAGLAPTIKLNQVDQALTHATTDSQSEAAHRAAALYAARLLAHFGGAQVLTWLRTGLPASALDSLK